MVRKTPLKSGGPLPAGKPLARSAGIGTSKPMSRARTPRLESSRAGWREIWPAVQRRDRSVCVMCGLAPGTTQHHRLPGGMGGTSRDPKAHTFARLMLACVVCHNYTEDHGTWAEARGWKIRHGVLGPADVPVFYGHQGTFGTRWDWVWLSDDAPKWSLCTDDEVADLPVIDLATVSGRHVLFNGRDSGRLQ